MTATIKKLDIDRYAMYYFRSEKQEQKSNIIFHLIYKSDNILKFELCDLFQRKCLIWMII